MNKSQRLFMIKLIHTVIWVFFVSVIFYVLYTGLTDTVNLFTWIGIAAVLAEGLILLIFRMFCPLTLLARKYSGSTRANFDIFLPELVARYNKVIFTSIFLVGLIVVIFRSL